MHLQVSGKRRLAAITVLTLALGCALVATAGSDVASRASAGTAPAAAASRPLAAALDSSGADSRWTPARMRRAEAASVASTGAGADGSASARASAGDRRAAAAAVPGFKSKQLDNTRAYPNRVHGRLFGAFEDGDSSRHEFSCSATVIGSGSQNLIVTAGHCVFDPDLGVFVSDLAFVPGYKRGAAPFGIFTGTHAVTPAAWSSRNSLDHDLALVQLAPDGEGREIGERVGTRGIDFDPPSRQQIDAFGYPAEPSRYDGEQLIRCRSRSITEPFGHTRTPSLGIGCDMESGASGGGWVAQGSLVVAVSSHGHSSGPRVIYGPRFGKAARILYRFSDPSGFPSVGPYECDGRAATIVGTDRGEKLKGTKGTDVIAALGGRDIVRGKGGNDRICLGEGDDVARAAGGNDRIHGGLGADVCDGGPGRDQAAECERTRRIP